MFNPTISLNTLKNNLRYFIYSKLNFQGYFLINRDNSKVLYDYGVLAKPEFEPRRDGYNFLNNFIYCFWALFFYFIYIYYW